MFKPIFSFALSLLLALAPVGLEAKAALIVSSEQNAQDGTVRGQVLDASGLSVIGASVQLKSNLSVGTITDMDGKYELAGVAPGTTLLFSCIGYVSQEIVFNGQEINVTLLEDTNLLDEVVVVGFGTQKKVNLTGAVSVTTGKEIQDRPVNNLSSAIQGFMPGLQVTGNSGDIESSMSIKVRGKGTIGEGSSDAPLVLIDGMEGDINSVNPQDVESISVLKDAASASIYGSRAAFGVLLVTTKKGSEGRVSVTYSNSFRVASPIRMPKAMNSYDFANYFNYAGQNAGWGANSIFSTQTQQNMLDFQAKGGTNKGGLLTNGVVWGKPAGDPFTTAYANNDWYKEIYKGGVFSHEHNAAVSGGSKNISYYASVSYLDYNGMLRHGSDNMQRYSANGKISAKIASWLTLDYGMKFVREDKSRPRTFGNNMYEKVGRQTWPNLPTYDENGYLFNCNADVPSIGLEKGGVRSWQVDCMYQQAALLIEPIKNWKTHVEFNYSTTSTDLRQTSIPYYNHRVDGTEDNTNSTSSLYQEFQKDAYLNWNIYSDYTFTVAKDHNFKVMVGLQTDETRQKFFSAEAFGLQDYELPELNLTTGLDGGGKVKSPNVHGYRNQWSTVGVFGRINYDYKGRYLIEGNIRADGSSRFRSDRRWTWSPSVSLGWNIAQEDFWKDYTNVCSTLKLRLSYGTLSNQNTNNWYPTYRTMTINQNSGSWLVDGKKPNTSWVNEVVSSSLTWERIMTYNAGLDWSLFNGRLTGSVDAFMRDTKDMVGPAEQLPNTFGQDAPKANNCDLRTSGWELTISWRDQLQSGFSYGISANISDSRTKIKSYPGNTTGSINTYNAGWYSGEIWGFETVGIAQSQAEMDAHLEKVGGQSALGNQWGAGDIMYADQDGKPGITMGAQTLDDHGDLKVIGNSTPRYFFGIDLNAQYKGFDLRVFFQGVAKRDYFNGTASFWGVTSNQWWSAAYGAHGDYWHAEELGLDGHKIAANTDAYYPRPVFDTDKNQQVQSKYLQNAAYMRLKNLQLGYTLPEKWTSKFSCSKLRIYVSVDNLCTITGLSKLFDPERVDGGYNGWGNSYPLARTWSFGLSLNF